MSTPLDVEAIRKDFPALSRLVRNDRPLIYLDSGATSQKPVQVLDAEREFYELHNGAAHRGAHLLSEEGTEIYEGARGKLAAFIGADDREIVFTKSATESINLVAYSLTGSIMPGDEILITESEHHANLVPWQQLAGRTGATLRWFTVLPDGRLDVDPALITDRTKIVALTGQSNVTGVNPPVADITRLAHEAGALVLCDGAQLVPHHPVDVRALDVDFLVSREGREKKWVTGSQRHRRDPAVRRSRARARGGRAGAVRRRAVWCRTTRWTSGRWTWTSWSSPGTRCSGRWGWVSCTASTPSSKRCRRSCPAGT